jgi:hypothetical protein
VELGDVEYRTDFAGDAVGHLRVVLKRHPGWAIDATIMAGVTGLVIAELHVVPRQELKVGPLGSRTGWSTGDFHEPPPGREVVWSGLPADVPPGGVPARLIRALNPGQLVAIAREKARGEAATYSERAVANVGDAYDPLLSTYLHYSAIAAGDLAETAPARRPGRHGHGIDHYLKWAARYVEKVDAGSRSPVSDLAREFGDSEGINRQYVRDTINDARHRHHLLTNPGQGRVGGQLTEKALGLLAERAQTTEDQ